MTGVIKKGHNDFT